MRVSKQHWRWICSPVTQKLEWVHAHLRAWSMCGHGPGVHGRLSCWASSAPLMILRAWSINTNTKIMPVWMAGGPWPVPTQESEKWNGHRAWCCGLPTPHILLQRRTMRPRGATSNRMRSLALVEGEVTLVNTPFSFTRIWNTSGTMPPVYLHKGTSVQEHGGYACHAAHSLHRAWQQSSVLGGRRDSACTSGLSTMRSAGRLLRPAARGWAPWWMYEEASACM